MVTIVGINYSRLPKNENGVFMEKMKQSIYKGSKMGHNRFH